MNTADTLLGAVSRERLADARLSLHWAVQPVASVGRTHRPHRDDDSHTNLGWSPATGALMGYPVGTPETAVGLRIRDLNVILVGPDQTVTDELPVAGRTMDETYSWIASRLGETSGALGGDLKRPDYDLPFHPSQHGSPFGRIDHRILAEWEQWYAVADELLGAIAREDANASVVRCWPHHFDIATLIALPKTGGIQPTIGVGMSPGDGAFDEPYWYVTPWPKPTAPQLAPLPAGGQWHEKEWFGAVLTATTLARLEDAQSQRNEIGIFLRAAVNAVR